MIYLFIYLLGANQKEHRLTDVVKEMEIKAMSEGINVLHNIWQSIVQKLRKSKKKPLTGRNWSKKRKKRKKKEKRFAQSSGKILAQSSVEKCKIWGGDSSTEIQILNTKVINGARPKWVPQG